MARSMMMFMMMMMTIIASMQMQSSMAQTRHVVGDALGWNIPSGDAAAYTTWASRQTFNVGDTLFFNFTTGFHNVAEVTEAAYGPCATTNPIATTTTGPATVTLTTSGEHYYICTVGTHCQLGQKLAINVSATTTTPSPTPVSPPTTTASPAPAPSTTTAPPTSASPVPSPAGASPPSPTTSGPIPTTPSPAGDIIPPPPPSSAAVRSFYAVAPATMLAVVFAFFY